MMGLHYCCRSSGRSAQSPRQKEGGRDWMEEVVVKVGRDATREKGVCDYGGKSLFFPLPSSPEQAPTHLAISALHKNACAILYVQVNVPKNVSGLKGGHLFRKYTLPICFEPNHCQERTRIKQMCTQISLHKLVFLCELYM